VLFPESCITRGIGSLKEGKYGEKHGISEKEGSFVYTKLITSMAHYFLHGGIAGTKQTLLQIKESRSEVLEQPNELKC